MNRFKYLMYPGKIRIKKILSHTRYFFQPNRSNKLKIIFFNNIESGQIEKVEKAADLMKCKITHRQLQHIYLVCMQQKRFNAAIKAVSRL